jgi:hypothetical protein
VTSDAQWTLTLDGHPPVPVTPHDVTGPTTHFRTSATLPLNPPGRRAALRATLTAPDGSEEAGVGSIDGIVRHDDRTTTTKLSFTPMLL